MKFLLPLFMLIGLVACKDDDSDSNDLMSIEKNGRTLAIDVNEGAGDYNTAFAKAKELGVDEIKQSWDWSAMESSTGYDFTFPDIANIFFPAQNMPVSLILRPISVNLKLFPDDLQSRDFDDQLVIDRFNAFLDALKLRISDLDIRAIYIGNEIDIYLGDDADQWGKFKRFFEATAAHARTLWGSTVKIGTVATLTALKRDLVFDLIQPIHNLSDVVGITYYPLEGDFQFKDPSVVSGDFDKMVELYSAREIRFTECGYATGAATGSSEEKQKQFVEEVFKAWDKHETKIRHIDFTWMHDLSQEKVDEFKVLFGISSNAFGEYLRTLGYRSHEGVDKAGFIQLKAEAEKRGW